MYSPRLYRCVTAFSLRRPVLLRQLMIGTASDIEFVNVLPASQLGTCHGSLASFRAAIDQQRGAIDRESVEVSTLVILTNIQRREILLGRKLRGFGTGKYNGFGGRLESEDIDPTPAHGARRELAEEANICIPLEHFSSVGTLNFSFEDSLQRMTVHLFHVNVKFVGDESNDGVAKSGGNELGAIIDPSTVRGCDEIVPKWFAWSTIPLKRQFADDSIWLTHLLSVLHSQSTGESYCNIHMPVKMNGWFHFGQGGDASNQILHYFLET